MGDTTRGNPLAVLGCPFGVGGGAPLVPNDGNGCANLRTFSVSLFANEPLYTTKVDYNLDTNNSFWFRVKVNEGSRTRPAPVSSLFDTVVSAPRRSGTAG